VPLPGCPVVRSFHFYQVLLTGPDGGKGLAHDLASHPPTRPRMTLRSLLNPSHDPYCARGGSISQGLDPALQRVVQFIHKVTNWKGPDTNGSPESGRR
jgi:hypothetical protein